MFLKNVLLQLLRMISDRLCQRLHLQVLLTVEQHSIARILLAAGWKQLVMYARRHFKRMIGPAIAGAPRRDPVCTVRSSCEACKRWQRLAFRGLLFFLILFSWLLPAPDLLVRLLVLRTAWEVGDVLLNSGGLFMEWMGCCCPDRD